MTWYLFQPLPHVPTSGTKTVSQNPHSATSVSTSSSDIPGTTRSSISFTTLSTRIPPSSYHNPISKSSMTANPPLTSVSTSSTPATTFWPKVFIFGSEYG